MFNVMKHSYPDNTRMSVSVTQTGHLESGDKFLMDAKKVVNKMFVLNRGESVCSNTKQLNLGGQYKTYIQPIIQYLHTNFSFVYQGNKMFRIGYHNDHYAYLKYLHIGAIPDKYNTKQWRLIEDCFGHSSYIRLQNNRSEITHYIRWERNDIDDQYVVNMTGLCNLVYINRHLSLKRLNELC